VLLLVRTSIPHDLSSSRQLIFCQQDMSNESARYGIKRIHIAHRAVPGCPAPILIPQVNPGVAWTHLHEDRGHSIDLPHHAVLTKNREAFS
jgi:hypothetical protein